MIEAGFKREQEMVTTTVVSTIDVQSAHTLALGTGDTLIVAQNAGIYWTDNSAITFLPDADSTHINIYGTADLASVTLAQYSTLLIGQTGSLTVSAKVIIGEGVSSSGSNAYLINQGSILGTSNSPGAIIIETRGGSNHLNNSGSISGIGIGIFLGSDDIGADEVVNSGLISVSETAVFMHGNSGSLANSGTLLGFIGVEVNGEQPSGSIAAMVVTNTGLIQGTYGILSSQTSVASTVIISNSGTISGDWYAINAGAGTEFIVNSGTLLGDVVLGAGWDQLDSRGGTIVGDVNLGDGGDLIDLRNAEVFGTITGGAGNDQYWVSDSNVRLLEAPDVGPVSTDIVYAESAFRLADNIEVLHLLGAGSFNGFGNASANTITGNSGDNRLVGLAGNDTMSGALGNDRLNGGAHADSLDGGDGDDTLIGNTFNDTLRGGDGDDLLNGGANKDLLTGGVGADIFVFSALSHSGNLTTTADIISDFVRGDDLIDLSAFDAKANNALPNDAFAFIGTAVFSSIAGQLRVAQSGGNTYVQMDANGDGLADAMVRINGLLTLNASDFIL